MNSHILTMSLALSVICSAYLRADETLTILPHEFTLHGSEARQPLIVERLRDGEFAGQVADGFEFQSSDPAIVKIEDGVALPVANGSATITAQVQGRAATANVVVAGMDRPHRWSFRLHVEPVLSKSGCNSGACHGAVAGKNGFKLSLRGYDPEFDFMSITRHARGRRIVPSDPGRSLLLTKPSGGIPHKGGLRFDVESREYAAIAQWIAHGQAPPAADDATLVKLEMFPEAATLKPGDSQQLLVRATYSDGRAEDVTRLVKFTAANESVARVDQNGRVDVAGYGEGGVIGWYLANNIVATITAPRDQQLEADAFSAAERFNFIDELVLAKLERLNIPPSPVCDDASFLRRAYLDTIGVLPTLDEAKAFLAEPAPDKRETLADELLARPEFVDYWAYKWSDVLLVSGARLRPQAVEAYYKWIRDRVTENAPWDEFARGILTSRGSTFENGAANFYALHQDPADMAENISMAFLGMSIQCAKCHDHPLEKWTNDQYYAMANLFARVRGKGWGGDFRSGDGNRSIFLASDGELIQPRTGKPRLPAPLDGEPIPFEATGDRREHLAKWLTARENPYFSRAIVNRVWANFLGVGLVENVDDLRLTNPASNEPLLAALAENLVDNRYDLKTLMRQILVSKTYQRSSEPLAGNRDDTRFYSRYFPRRMQAEVLLDALSQAAGKPTLFKDKPVGTRALQLADASVESYFLSTFGRPERIITCECERSSEPSMVQVLHIMNGATLNEKLEAPDNRLSDMLKAGATDPEIVESAYLSALSRYPTDQERQQILAELAQTPAAEKRQAFEDLYWGILSSKEFLFHH